jgi:hypothetical protein
MADFRGSMLVFRCVDLVSRVVVGCGRISDHGVCPCEVLLGGGLVFFARDGCLSLKYASFTVSWLGFARGGGVRQNLL